MHADLKAIRRGLLAAGLVAAATLLLAAAAHADSLLFIKSKKNLLYVAKPDGSQAHRLAKGGGYYWPSQADNGTIVAAGGRARVNLGGTDSSGGTELYRFDRRGRRLGRPITTPGSHSTPQCPTYAPQSVRVSPDGRRIAYSIFFCDHMTTFWTPTNSRGLRFPGQTLGQEGTIHPVWMNERELLLGRVGTPVTEDQRELGTYRIGAGDNTAQSWFNGTPAFESDFEATISRKGDKIAVFSFGIELFGDTASASLRLFTTNGPPPAQPTLRCELTLPASAFPQEYRLALSPSFSPNGRYLAYGARDGIHILTVSDVSNCATVRQRRLIRRAGFPYYGKPKAPKRSKPGAPKRSKPGAPKRSKRKRR